MLLNHDRSIPYDDYIKNIKNNTIVTKVKLADLKHNSDLDRLDTITENDKERYLKYQESIKFLEK